MGEPLFKVAFEAVGEDRMRELLDEEQREADNDLSLSEAMRAEFPETADEYLRDHKRRQADADAIRKVVEALWGTRPCSFPACTLAAGHPGKHKSSADALRAYLGMSQGGKVR